MPCSVDGNNCSLQMLGVSQVGSDQQAQQSAHMAEGQAIMFCQLGSVSFELRAEHGASMRAA